MNLNNVDSVITFRGLPWFDLATSSFVSIGGAGGIGSWLTLFLSRAGVKSYVYDFDTVESRNLGGQLYMIDAIGMAKVNALAKVIDNFSSLNYMNAKMQLVEASTPVSSYCFSAFDNMKARRDMFTAWKRKVSTSGVDAYKSIFIDGRLEAEFFQIYCVTPNRMERYEATLFDDSEIMETACSVKQTSHVAAMIGSFMTSFFTNHLTNISEGMKVREVPFKYEVFLPLIKIYEE